MTTTSLDISGKLDPEFISLFRDFSLVAGTTPWMLVGATSRDIFLHHEHGLAIQRATKDVDLGVQVSSWRHYEDLKTELLKSGKFSETSVQHRLTHASGLPLDLLPFGGVASVDGQIRWPTSKEQEMSVVGYDDVLNASTKVKINSNPDLLVPVATIPGITILKLIAWADSPSTRKKDIQDLALIIDEYLDLGNWDRLQGTDSDLTRRADFEMQSVGAELLGRDVAAIANPLTRKTLAKILSTQVNMGELAPSVQIVAKSLNGRSYASCANLLQRLQRGVEMPL